jgi:hypothetical protein
VRHAAAALPAARQRPKLGRLQVGFRGRLALVDRQRHGLGRVRAAQPRQDLLVARLGAGLPVHDEQHRVGLRHPGRRLRLDRARQALCRDGAHPGLALGPRGQARGVRHQAAGVHEQELAVAPEGARVQAVAGDPGGVVHHRQRPAGEAVEHGRLAHVRAADDRQLWQGVVGHALGAAAGARDGRGEGEGRGEGGGVAVPLLLLLLLLLLEEALLALSGVGALGGLGERESARQEGFGR